MEGTYVGMLQIYIHKAFKGVKAGVGTIIRDSVGDVHGFKVKRNCGGDSC